MSFNSVYRIYRYSCHNLFTPPFLCKSKEFTDFVGECRLCAAVTAASATYTPVNTILLCAVSVPSSGEQSAFVFLPLQPRIPRQPRSVPCVLVTAEGLAVALQDTCCCVPMPLQSCRLCRSDPCCCISTGTVLHYTDTPRSHNQSADSFC